MPIPESLAGLAELGIIEEVIRPLMSGKEAQVYLVIAGGEERVAKIYKEAQDRTFKHRAEYTEGRKVRNTRDQRAIGKHTTHGRAQDEAAWRSTEVDMIYRLRSAGVRVPVPYHFIDGVLIMELITDRDGNPAPRLGELRFSAEEATAIFERLLREVVRMLCAGVVHGDLSDFNVLMAADGPVLIDFPQSVDSAHNPNARKLLLRDVDNLHSFLTRFARNQRRLPYAEEMWELYQSNGLAPETALTGRFRPADRSADTASVLALINEANQDETRRRERLGLKGGPAVAAQRQQHPPKRVETAKDLRSAKPGERSAPRPNPPSPTPIAASPAPEGKRRAPRGRRRRRGRRNTGPAPASAQSICPMGKLSPWRSRELRACNGYRPWHTAAKVFSTDLSPGRSQNHKPVGDA
jgi:RIO kinase 1